jgi:antirestriction protein ArdC
MYTNMNLSDKAKESLNKVIIKFQSGDLSPITQSLRIQLDPSAPASKWTLANRVLAYSQSLSVDCRGFRQWEQVGRKVKKGTRAVYILRPRTITKEEEGKEPESICVGFAAIPVFAIEATEGEPVPSYAPSAPPPLYDLALRMGIDVIYAPLPEDRWGDYSPSRDSIRLATHDEATFFHELAHAAHKRLRGELKEGQDAEQETVADLAACVLMDLYGLRDDTGNTWKYIFHYHPDPLTAICKAVSEVEQVLAVLLAGEAVDFPHLRLA